MYGISMKCCTVDPSGRYRGPRLRYEMGRHFPFEPGSNVPPNNGFGLPVVYLVWILVVIALYPVCRWFADVKRRRREAWLSYL